MTFSKKQLGLIRNMYSKIPTRLLLPEKMYTVMKKTHRFKTTILFVALRI